MNPVLASIAPVIERARHLSFDPEAAERFVQALGPQVEVPPWEGRYHFQDGTARTVAYVLVLDSLNFCFWGEPRWRITHRGERLDGYFALAAALKAAFEAGWPLDRADYLAEIPRQDAARLLAGEGELPLFEERVRILRELGRGLEQRFAGQVTQLVERAQGSALALVGLLVENFPSFHDETTYRGHRVCFYKRAQILCADLYGTFGGQRWGAFSDLGELTAFADYKLPQLLRARGVLRYRPSLAGRVDRQSELPAGSEEEVEIRAFTVHAVERLKALLNARGVRPRRRLAPSAGWTSVEVDWLLWHRSQGLRAQPYHRTRTIFY